LVELQKHCNKIFVIGVSLGASLSFILTSKFQIAGVVSIGGAYKIYGKLRWLAYLGRILWPIFPYYRKSYQKGRLSSEIIAQRVGYERISVRAVGELKKALKAGAALLSKINCPVLLIQAVNDHAVAENNISKIVKHLASKDIRIIKANAYHVVIIDENREKYFREIENFIEQNL